MAFVIKILNRIKNGYNARQLSSVYCLMSMHKAAPRAAKTLVKRNIRAVQSELPTNLFISNINGLHNGPRSSTAKRNNGICTRSIREKDKFLTRRDTNMNNAPTLLVSQHLLKDIPASRNRGHRENSESLIVFKEPYRFSVPPSDMFSFTEHDALWQRRRTSHISPPLRSAREKGHVQHHSKKRLRFRV